MCKYFNDLFKGQALVNPEFRQMLMQKTDNYNAKVRLELVSRLMEPQTTAYLVLCYGDEGNKYQHCQVLGIMKEMTTDPVLSIFASVEKLAKICIPGFISIDLLENGETFQYTDKQARDYYGVDMTRIRFDDDPVEKDLLLVTQINIATNEEEFKEAAKIY